MWQRIVRAALLASAMSGCATVTTGSLQPVAVDTDPAGASCTFVRDGVAIAFVAPTPGSALVERSSHPISVACRKEDHRPATALLAPGFQTMTLGNVLIGGLVGIAVDAASGAMNEYPSTLQVILTPESFESAAARDEHFRKLLDDLDRTYLVARRKLMASTSCNTSSSRTGPIVGSECERQATALEQARHGRLHELEQQRLASPVRQ